jgi:periplasmic copper chaperone A
VPVYMVVHNTGGKPDRLLAATSPLATKAELRASKSAGPAQRQDIEIRPKEIVELTPDGPHIMLLGLKEPLNGYQYFPLWLTFERAGRIGIEVYVEEPN